MGMTTGLLTARVDVVRNNWVRLTYDTSLIADTTILIRCDHRNKGNIWLSNSPEAQVNPSDGTRSAFPLMPGDVCSLDFRKPFDLWVCGDSDSINYLWWIAT